MLQDNVQLTITGINATLPAFAKVTADLRTMGDQIKGLNTLMGQQKSVTDAVTRGYKALATDGTTSIRTLRTEVSLLTKDIQFQIDEIARLGVAYGALKFGPGGIGGGGGGGGARTPAPTGSFSGTLPLSQQAAYIAAQERQAQIDALVAQNMTKGMAGKVVGGGSFIAPSALPAAAKSLTPAALQALAADQAKQDRLSQLVQGGIPLAQARRVQTLESSALAAQQRAAAASAAAQAASGTTGARAATQLAAREDAAAAAEARKVALARNQIIAGLSEKAGLGGRFGFATGLLGPVAIGGAITGVAGFLASKAGADFQSAVVHTIAQTDRSRDPNVLNRDAAQLGNTILDYTQKGTSFYTPTNIATSLVPLLSHGYSQAAVNAILPGLSTFSKQNAAPDLNTAENLLNIGAQQFYQGPKTSGANLNKFLDYASALEKMSSVKPGEVTAALPTVFTAISGTGISKEEAGGLYLKLLASNPNARQDAQGFRALAQDLTTKNTAGALKEAGRIGLAMGPGAVSAYGGIYNYLQEVNRTTLAAAGGDVQQQRKELAMIFPQKNALSTYINLMQGGGLGQAQGMTLGLANAAGTLDATQAELSKGVNQQATMLMTHFNTDLIKVGDTINDKVVPQLILAAGKFLTAAEGAVSRMGDLGHQMDLWSAQLNLPGKASAAKEFIDKHVPGGVGTIVGGGLIPAAYGVYNALQNNAGGSAGSTTAQPGMHMITVGAGRHVWVPNPVQTTAPPRAAALPPGIVASHGGYQNAATGQWWQTLSEAQQAVQPAVIGMGQSVSTALPPIDNERVRHLGSERMAIAANNTAAQDVARTAYIIKTVDNAVTVAAMVASENAPAKLSAAAQNQATRDARTTLNSDILAGKGRAAYNQDLLGIAGALTTSVYTQAQQRGILTTESTKVGKLNLADDKTSLATGLAQYKLGNLSTADLRTLLKNELQDIPFAGLSKAQQKSLGTTAGTQVGQAIYLQTQLDAANMQLHAAQINQESARIHHASTQVQIADARATYGATQQVIKAQIDHKDLKGVDIKAAYDAAKDTLDQALAVIAQNALIPLQDRVTNAQLRNDPAAFKKAIKDEIAFDMTPDSLARLFGGSTVAQSNAVLGLQQQAGTFMRLPGPQLIRPNTTGLGFPLAGPGSTIAQLSGGTSGPAQTIALLQAQLRKEEQANGELRQMVAYLRQLVQGVKETAVNTRPKPQPPASRAHKSTAGMKATA